MDREAAFSDYVAARRANLFRTACVLCGDPQRIPVNDEAAIPDTLRQLD